MRMAISPSLRLAIRHKGVAPLTWTFNLAARSNTGKTSSPRRKSAFTNAVPLGTGIVWVQGQTPPTSSVLAAIRCPPTENTISVQVLVVLELSPRRVLSIGGFLQFHNIDWWTRGRSVPHHSSVTRCEGRHWGCAQSAQWSRPPLFTDY